jgi:serine/threonine-protein kinase
MSDETMLEEMLSRWQPGQARGEAVTPEVLCRDRPDLLPELQRRIALLRPQERHAGSTGSHVPDDPYATKKSAAPLVPPPAAASHSWPTLLGYEILGELGRGGMGVVYKARQLAADRVVAVKMTLHGSHAGDNSLARLYTEARAIARLQHPHIVQIYEVGEQAGLPYFSLEFCPGGSLDKKLNGTPLPSTEAAKLVEKLSWAMHVAHREQIIHRDLKPSNVLLAADGTPKVTDFGLAKRLDEPGLTASDAVMGPPCYMAPEQARGRSKDVGPAADVYALGAILYECLTGRPPFKAATALDTIMKVINEKPVPPTRLQRRTPRELEAICLKCLQKEPAQRYATAEDLRRFSTQTLWGRIWRWAKCRSALVQASCVMAAIAALGYFLGPEGRVVAALAALVYLLSLLYRRQFSGSP